MRPDFDDPKLTDARAALEAMGHDHSIDCLNDLPARLSTFPRSHVTNGKFPGLQDFNLPIDKGVESAIRLGSPSIRDEAYVFRLLGQWWGAPSPHVFGNDSDRIYLGFPVLSGRGALASIVILCRNLKVVDFADAIPEAETGPIWDLYGNRLAEKTSVC